MLNFKLLVKQSAVNFENRHSEDMYQHFLNKNMLMSGDSLRLDNAIMVLRCGVIPLNILAFISVVEKDYRFISIPSFLCCQ